MPNLFSAAEFILLAYIARNVCNVNTCIEHLLYGWEQMHLWLLRYLPRMGRKPNTGPGGIHRMSKVYLKCI